MIINKIKKQSKHTEKENEIFIILMCALMQWCFPFPFASKAFCYIVNDLNANVFVFFYSSIILKAIEFIAL